jgi:signal transduction histidine kinase
MTTAGSPLKRFLLHSLWVVLPFCALLALTWSAWRADADTRSQRILESARLAADRALDEIRSDAGPWSPLPIGNNAENPPAPNDDPAAKSARDRYEAGDYEGVLGSPESLRSAAGLPLRKLAALQLLRKESDLGRLGELAGVLAGSLDFTSPPFLEEAERRFAELEIEPPPALKNWRERWQRAETEAALFQTINNTDDDSLSRWIEQNGTFYLFELNPKAREWRVWSEAEMRAIASKAQARESTNLPDGTALRLTVAEKIMAGRDGKYVLASINREPWRAEIVLADAAAFSRNDVRTRNFMTAVVAVAGLAVVFGLVQAGRAYLRAVELARRQSEFMAAVSHEMRTPLAAMRLLAENLESGVADRAGQREEHTRMIREECSRLGDLVDNVLAFTRGGNAETHEAFDVAAMVADAISLVKPMASRKNVALAVEVADFPEPPVGDVSALRRALLNLLDNALKHTPDGGNVTCHTGPAGEKSWRITVSDSGPGVPDHERGKIFDAFYRIGDELRRTTPGTGLGLALVKRTAEAHGGTVTVEDAAGGGACFILSLPIKP